MAKKTDLEATNLLKDKSDKFLENMNSNMQFKSGLASEALSFDWLDEIEIACPYIDNIVRNPHVSLTSESEVVNIEKARKVSVESVKDLSKNTQYIDKVDKLTEEIEPSKLLIVRREETLNTYENRMVFTLISNLEKFIMKKEDLLNEIKTESDKVLEYSNETSTLDEKINIELKVSSKIIPKDGANKDFEKEINSCRERIKKLNYYLTSWRKSQFVTVLEKSKAILVFPPIKKTNLILKNPNFQIATALWEFLYAYEKDDEKKAKGGLDTPGDKLIKGILDDSFLMDYFVLDSISSSKKEQKEKLSNYAIIMIKQQVKRAVSLLLNNGIDISNEEIIQMVADEIKKEKEKSLVDSKDVKNQFKSVINEYLERTQDYL